MTTFNTEKKTNSEKEIRVNHEGGVVHGLDALETLFSKVLGSFFGESTAYEGRNAEWEFQQLVNLIESVPEEDKEYVLKVAELGRRMNMIRYPLEVLTASFNSPRYRGEAFLGDDGRNKLAVYADNIVLRTKDVNSILATQLDMYGREHSIPKQMRKNLKTKLESFDRYKLSKGLDTSKSVSLADSIKLLRPRPKTEEMGEFFRAIIEGKVVLGDDKRQIQTELTRLGQSGQEEHSIKDLKQSLLDSNLQALIKNLVNLEKNGVFEDEAMLHYAIDKMTDKGTVLASKLLPFRFLTAHKALSLKPMSSTTTRLIQALEKGMDLSLDNVENIGGQTALLVDVSGSMQSTYLSERSSVSAKDISLLLAAIAYKKGMGDLFLFATHVVKVDVSPDLSVFDIVRKLESVDGVGHTTNLKKALNAVESTARAEDILYNNLLILSDNDCYGYDSDRRELTFGEDGRCVTPFLRNLHMGDKTVKSNDTADNQVDRLVSEGIVEKVWMNNLGGNDFSVLNTKGQTKNLITGFSERYINAINIYNSFGEGRDIRNVIDEMLAVERTRSKKESETAR